MTQVTKKQHLSNSIDLQGLKALVGEDGKNAGPFELTFDIMFDDVDTYEAVKASGAITAQRVANIYKVSHNEVLVCRAYDPALAFKITIRRPVGSGDRGETDVYGCQQHMPLTTLDVPLRR